MATRVISFHYLLTNRLGEKLDSSEGAEPFTFLEGAKQIIPGLEKELLSLKPGDKKKITVVAVEAYGEHKKEYVMTVPRDRFPAGADIKIGDRFRGGEDPTAPVFTVMGVTDTEVTVDGNHPLAGQDLTFEIEIVATREATADELKHGHAHGKGGHHH